MQKKNGQNRKENIITATVLCFDTNDLVAGVYCSGNLILL